MAEQEMTEEQMVEAIYGFAAEQIKAGVKPPEIEKRLVEKGLDEDSAKIVVANLIKARVRAEYDSSVKNMIYGALWCIGGSAVTAATYSAAANANGGGKYVVAWGAILFGGFQFLGGLFTYLRGAPDA